MKLKQNNELQHTVLGSHTWTLSIRNLSDEYLSKENLSQRSKSQVHNPNIPQYLNATILSQLVLVSSDGILVSDSEFLMTFCYQKM